MQVTTLPKPKSLAWWESFFEGEIKASALRAEVKAGRLKAYRSRPGCNGKILVDNQDMSTWLREHAGQRHKALSPAEAKRINEDAAPSSYQSGSTKVDAKIASSKRKRRSRRRA